MVGDSGHHLLELVAMVMLGSARRGFPFTGAEAGANPCQHDGDEKSLYFISTDTNIAM